MTIKTKILFQALFVLVAFGVTLQAFATWVPPMGQPPNGGNTEPPINAGPITQAKDGGIVAFGGLRSGSVLIVDGTSTLKGNVTIEQGKTLTINTETYNFPANQVANGFLKTDGAGVLTWDTSGGGGGVADGDKGDIVVSGGGTVWDIDAGAVGTAEIANDAVNSSKILNDAVNNTKIINDAVTYAKLQNVAANSFLANTTGLPADVQEIDTNRIPLFASAITGTANSTTFLRGDGSWQTAGGADNLGNHTATTQILSTIGTAAAPGYSFVGDLNNGIFSPSADTFAITTAGTERLRISSSGQVGIGAVPSYKFHVLGETRLVGSGGGYSLTAMAGNVGIGSSAPLELLSVGNNINGNLGVMSLSNAVSGRVIIQPNTGSFTTYTLTLPTTDGAANEYLKTDGNGNLSWATAGGADNLGNHTATEPLKMAGFTINGNSTVGGSLTLDSTSDPTKGDVIIQPTSGDVILGAGASGSKLSVNGNISAGTYSATAGPANGMIISGTVGIGESSPTLGKLVVKGGDIAITNTGTAGLLKLYEPSASGTNFSGFRSGAQAVDLTYTLPLTAPLAGEVLSSDASGNLDWITAGGADNLGNHTATTQILSTIGTAAAPGYSFVGDLNNGIFSPSADTFAITTAGTERLRISSSGQVGIGKTPTKLLDVNGDALINGITAGRGGGNVLSNTVFGGGNALIANTTGTVNVAFGYGSLATNTTGSSNSAFGNSALNGLSSGSDNTAIGFTSSSGLITGSQNTAIGSNTIIINGLTNATAIGYGANAATSNSMTFGNTSVTRNVFNGGVIVNNNNSAKPTCNSGVRGMFFVVQGATGVKDNVEVCAKDAANVYAWRVIY